MGAAPEDGGLSPGMGERGQPSLRGLPPVCNMNKDIIWKIGEDAAKNYLESKNYKIIEKNYRTKYAEIDLVARKDNILIFVEVRTKRSRAFVAPEESINYKKLKKLYWNANAYVAFKKWKGAYRIDAICIVLNPDNTVAELEHFEGI